MHLHLARFEIVTDFIFTYEVDGDQEVEMHDGAKGTAPKISWVSDFEYVARDSNYYDLAPKDSVTVLPGNPDLLEGRGTVIRAKFPKMGIYEWHCHILSHEDHEMMRIFEVVAN
jgi:spore coat protein A, manganese oxidase